MKQQGKTMPDETNKPYNYVEGCKVKRLIKNLKGTRMFLISYDADDDKGCASVLAKHQL